MRECSGPRGFTCLMPYENWKRKKKMTPLTRGLKNCKTHFNPKHENFRAGMLDGSNEVSGYNAKKTNSWKCTVAEKILKPHIAKPTHFPNPYFTLQLMLGQSRNIFF